MDIHMPAVDNQILKWNGLIPYLLHIIFPEICDIDHHVSSENLDQRGRYLLVDGIFG